MRDFIEFADDNPGVAILLAGSYNQTPFLTAEMQRMRGVALRELLLPFPARFAGNKSSGCPRCILGISLRILCASAVCLCFRDRVAEEGLCELLPTGNVTA
jgi:hypothetical protein